MVLDLLILCIFCGGVWSVGETEGYMYTCTGTCRYEGRVVMGAGFMVVHVYRRKYVGGRGDERKAGGEHVTIELKGEREGSLIDLSFLFLSVLVFCLYRLIQLSIILPVLVCII